MGDFFEGLFAIAFFLGFVWLAGRLIYRGGIFVKKVVKRETRTAGDDFAGAVWFVVIGAAVVIRLIWDFNSSPSEKIEASAAAGSHLSGCSTDHVADFTAKTLSWNEASGICSAINNYLTGHPRVDVFKKMQQAVSLLQMAGYDLPPEVIADQFMRIVMLRKQASNPDAILVTIDTVFKIYNGSSGAIPPTRVITVLQVYGEDGEHLSEEGLVNLVVAASN